MLYNVCHKSSDGQLKQWFSCRQKITLPLPHTFLFLVTGAACPHLTQESIPEAECLELCQYRAVFVHAERSDQYLACRAGRKRDNRHRVGIRIGVQDGLDIFRVAQRADLHILCPVLQILERRHDV